jgi:hypothetical protein
MTDATMERFAEAHLDGRSRWWRRRAGASTPTTLSGQTGASRAELQAAANRVGGSSEADDST